MASSSSSSPPKKYQVFLSFRGEDTRRNFTSHLLKALTDSAIEVFFDENNLETGDEINPELLKAIIASKISIVILSKNYAFSPSCLAELSQIMQCKRTQGQLVVPIFYHVNPSDVRNHGESFKESFDEHLRNRPDEIEKWKAAFTEVGKLKGLHIAGNFFDRPEPEYIKDIVQDVIDKLNSKSSSGSKDQLVGNQKKEVMSLLRIPEEDPRIIGIWGMGGIGKTTLAQAIYDEVSTKFDSCYFLHNVRQKFEKQGMESLRDEFLSRVLKQEVHVDTPLVGRALTQDRLRMKRVFVVLDDVSHYDQIEALGVKHFGRGSKIILTSRDKQVLKTRNGVIYEVKRLNYDHSRKLFSKFAFHQDKPVADFRDLSDNFAEYAGGVPLALKVLGCALYQRPKEYWKNTLDKLKEYPEREIFDVLKISFEALDDLEKDIFLDIACFFECKDGEAVTEILEGCYKGAYCKISNLVDKCLIYNTLSMHDLLREMGRKIIDEKSKDPGKRSRLCNSKDVYRVLKNNTGTESIKGISLDLSEIGELQLCPTIFEKMVDLRIIKFYYPSGTQNKEFKVLLLDEGLKSLPDELRYLRWDVYPLKSFPSNFSPQNLVKLKLTHSNIEQLWNGNQDLVNLRVIKVKGCKNLTKISNLLQAINIRDLCIELCESLVELPCLNHFTNLEQLTIRKCPITKFPEVPVNIKFLDLGNTQIGEVPASIECLEILERLSMRRTMIQNLPTCVAKLDSLRLISLSGCPNITNFPNVPERIKGLYLGCTAIEEVPSSISRFECLELLFVDGCKMLKSITGLPPSLEDLRADGCKSLEKLTYPCAINDSFRWALQFSYCFGLNPEEIDNIVAYALLKSKSIAKYLVEKWVEFDPVGYVDPVAYVVCCVPGNEISERFENRSDNFSIIVKLGSNRCGQRGGFWGFVLCSVLDLNLCPSGHVVFECNYQLKTQSGDYRSDKFEFYYEFDVHPVEPYKFPSEHMLIFFDDTILDEDEQYEEASFKFYLSDCTSMDGQMEKKNVKVIKCGVHVFYVDAESSDDFRSAVRSQTSSSGSHLSLIKDDGNGSIHDTIQPNTPVDPNRLSLKCGDSSSYVGVINIENEPADLTEEDINGNFRSLDDKEEPEHKRQKLFEFF